MQPGQISPQANNKSRNDQIMMRHNENGILMKDRKLRVVDVVSLKASKHHKLRTKHFSLEKWWFESETMWMCQFLLQFKEAEQIKCCAWFWMNQATTIKWVYKYFSKLICFICNNNVHDFDLSKQKSDRSSWIVHFSSDENK